ncbi:unannotated protein [freshwater metagenome]|jgi:hypothetical protein|uniref:Unannotated protein n=1 Tax=freshwater metagenome TaxID=449393 RepID=A0A6J7N1Q7_9ZZZZ
MFGFPLTDFSKWCEMAAPVFGGPIAVRHEQQEFTWVAVLKAA